MMEQQLTKVSTATQILMSLKKYDCIIISQINNIDKEYAVLAHDIYNEALCLVPLTRYKKNSNDAIGYPIVQLYKDESIKAIVKTGKLRWKYRRLINKITKLK